MRGLRTEHGVGLRAVHGVGLQAVHERYGGELPQLQRQRGMGPYRASLGIYYIETMPAAISTQDAYRGFFIQIFGNAVFSAYLCMGLALVKTSQCKDYGCPDPTWRYDGVGLWLTMPYKQQHGQDVQVSVPDNDAVNKSEYQHVADKLIQFCSSSVPVLPPSWSSNGQNVAKLLMALYNAPGDHALGILELMNIVGETAKPSIRRKYLLPLLAAHVVEMTIPDKPNSRNQRYRLTKEGISLLGHI